jgi:phosphoribosylformylglycinamidine synthase
LAEKGLLHSASDLSDGGCAVAFAKACFPRNLGVTVSMRLGSDDPFTVKERLFSEIGSSVIATADPAKLEEIQTVLRDYPGVWSFRLGDVTGGNYKIVLDEKTVIDEPVKQLKTAWATAMESQLADEVVTA